MPSSVDPLLLVLGAALFAATAAAAIAAWQILGRLRASEKHLERLGDLAVLREQLERLAGASPELELRRIEHVLLDLRDATRRSEERMLALIESTRAGVASGLPVPAAAGGALLAERVVTRMLALGYERVQIVSRPAELEALLAGEGPVTIEARRDGVVCKGRVLVQAGAIQDVQMQSAYSAFP